MSNYRRWHIPGKPVFFTARLDERGSSLLVEEVVRLRAAVRATMEGRPFDIVAWVVLPDHMHCLWRLPEGDNDYSTRWRLIKGRFAHGLDERTRSASKRHKKERGLWQRRFWEHHVRGAADFDAHMRYCWGDPVKHGLVTRAADWPYSSFHRDVLRGRVGADWSGPVPDGDFGE